MKYSLLKEVMLTSVQGLRSTLIFFNSQKIILKTPIILKIKEAEVRFIEFLSSASVPDQQFLSSMSSINLETLI